VACSASFYLLPTYQTYVYIFKNACSMRFIGKTYVTAPLCLLAFFCHFPVSVRAKTSTAPAVPTTSSCPSRTINYITETLPQQCLRADWSSNITATEVRNAAGPAVVESALITIEQFESATPDVSQDVASTTKTIANSPSAENTLLQEQTITSTTYSTTTVSHSPVPVSSVDLDVEADPLSDNANFLSFEEWKAQMLVKAGQSAENIGGVRQGDANLESRRHPAGVHHALDSLGDENEIELDFSGFVNSDSMPEAVPPVRKNGAVEDHTGGRTIDDAAPPRSKEAGTTSKERFNYASFDCAATVLKKNGECKGPNSILLENKDSYMLNPCKAKNKFFIVELCNDILIDTVALGNYEFFSSTFRTFKVSISDRYPVKADKWRELGTFEAQNTRGVQAFVVENGLIWARYLRIEFLTHYGNEYYCPVSILRVHGKTMIDDYRNDMKAARGDDDADEEDEMEPETSPGDVKVEKITPIVTPTLPVESGASESSDTKRDPAQEQDQLQSNGHGDPNEFKDKCPRTNYVSALVQQADLMTSNCRSSRRYCNLELTPKINATARQISTHTHRGSRLEKDTTDEQPVVSRTLDDQALEPVAVNSTTQASPQTSTQRASSNSSNAVPVKSEDNSTTATTPTSSGSVASHPSKVATQPPAASPSTQESFFKSVHKRLQLLEANSTLSLQYIEEQSRILREAFTKVERRQLNKTTTFLESLNTTVLGELREFRLQYEQIWQSTILELSSQREQSHF
jgi:hypothetical protein